MTCPKLHVKGHIALLLIFVFLSVPLTAGGVFTFPSTGSQIQGAPASDKAAGSNRKSLEASETDGFYHPFSVYLLLEGNPSTSMGVRWITKDDRSDDLVQLRQAEDQDWINIVGSSQPMPDDYPYIIHQVQLNGLAPETDYCFRIGEDGAPLKFRTLPASLDKPIRFAVGGDMYHDELEIFAQMNRTVAAQNPMFVVLGGDIAYTAPKLPFFFENFSRWMEWLSTWKETMIAEDGRLIPFITAIGNHEVIGRFAQTPEKAEFFSALFSSPELKSYQAIDFGSFLTIFLLDTGHVNSIDGEQKQWLRQAMQERSVVTHKFAVYHVPAYPSVRKFNNRISKQLREHWVPLFEAHGLNAAFEHHEHAYKRTHPIMAGIVNSEKGVLYLGDGSWGIAVPRKPKTSNDRWYLAKSRGIRHFLMVTIEGSQRHYSAIDQAGNVFDRTSN